MSDKKINIKKILPDEVNLEVEIRNHLKTKVYSQLLLYSIWKLQNNQKSIKVKEISGKFNMHPNLARYYLEIMTTLQFFVKRKMGRVCYFIIRDVVKNYRKNAEETLSLV